MTGANGFETQYPQSKQVEIGKRERMLASAEIEGLKKYHFNEMHELQDQLLAQRSVVSKLTLRMQEAMQVCLHPQTAGSPDSCQHCPQLSGLSDVHTMRSSAADMASAPCISTGSWHLHCAGPALTCTFQQVLCNVHGQ